MNEILNNPEVGNLMKNVLDKLTNKDTGVVVLVGGGIYGIYKLVREGLKYLGK